MNRLTLLVFITLLFCLNNVILSQHSWEQTGKFGKETLMNPGGIPVLSFNSFIMDNNGRLIVYDSQGLYPFYFINTEDGTLTGFGQWGSGPGEVARGTPKNISITNNRIIVHEYVERKIVIFSSGGSYINEIRLPAFLGPIGYLHIISGDLLLFRKDFYSPNYESTGFAKLIEYSEDGRMTDTDTYIINYNENPDLRPIMKNATLKTGPIFSDRNGYIYVGTLYSSLVLCVREDGTTVFKTYEPQNAHIPNVEIEITESIMSGEPEESIHYSISFDADDNYLYVLHSGRKYKREEIISALQTGGTYDLRIGEGKTLLIYNKKTGEFLNSLKLPVWASNFVVDDKHIYLLVMDKDPYIVQYLKPIIE